QVDNVDVHWTLNGAPQPPISITTPIDSVVSPNNWTEVHLGEIMVPYGTNTTIKAWTHLPNGVVDSFNENDTLLAVFSAPRQGIDFPPLPDTVICEGDVITYNPQGNFPGSYYVWSHGHLGQNAQISDAGQYWVWVYNDDACEVKDTFSVSVEPYPS